MDGYPKDSSQAASFVQLIGPPTTVIHLGVPAVVMNARLKERNNFDDTQESIYKRINEFNTCTMPLVRKWNAISIEANREKTEVFKDIKTALKAEKAFEEIELDVDLN